MSVRVRFAPSPTGLLHIGNARTALFNWLYARRNEGTFVFRIEDTDRERSTKESEQSIIDDLRWLGLDWDEGVEKGGEHGPYRQSERTEIYIEHRDKLLESGHAYKCFCTVEELEAMKAEQRAKKEPPGYTGKCRSLTAEEVEAFEKDERTHVIRLRVDPEEVKIQDMVRGEVCFDSQSLGGDFILFRGDGGVMFNFAVVIDDATMQVTHVLRGEDHLTNTAKQLLLYRALGYEPPRFGHMAMILGPDKAKLSKRHGTVSLRQFKEEGYLADALFNYMSLLGWSPGDDREKMTRDEIVKGFTTERLLKAASIFDFKKLRWMNANYIREFDKNQLYEAVKPYFAEIPELEAQWGADWVKELVWLFHDKIDVLIDMREKVLAVARLTLADDAKTMLSEEGSKLVLGELRRLIDAMAVLDQPAFESALSAVQENTEAKGRKLYMPIRAMMIGSPHGPDVRIIGPMLGKEEVLRRIDTALEC